MGELVKSLDIVDEGGWWALLMIYLGVLRWLIIMVKDRRMEEWKGIEPLSVHKDQRTDDVYDFMIERKECIPCLAFFLGCVCAFLTRQSLNALC